MEIPKIKLKGDAEEALRAKVAVIELRVERYKQIDAVAAKVIEEAQKRAQQASQQRKRAQDDLTASDANLRESLSRWLNEAGHELPDDAIAVAVRDDDGELTGEITWRPAEDASAPTTPTKPESPAKKAARGRKKAAKKKTTKKRASRKR